MRAVFVILCRQIRRVDLSHQVSDGQRAGRYPDRLYHRHEIQSVVGLNLSLLAVIKVTLYIGMPQDSSFEWKSESQIKFLDENQCTHAVLGALCDTIRLFWIQCHLVTEL